MKRKNGLILVIFILALVVLGGCGKKEVIEVSDGDKTYKITEDTNLEELGSDLGYTVEPGALIGQYLFIKHCDGFKVMLSCGMSQPEDSYFEEFSGYFDYIIIQGINHRADRIELMNGVDEYAPIIDNDGIYTLNVLIKSKIAEALIGSNSDYMNYSTRIIFEEGTYTYTLDTSY